MIAHTFYPRTWWGRNRQVSMSLRPNWSSGLVPRLYIKKPCFGGRDKKYHYQHNVFTVWADSHHILDPEHFTIPRRSRVLPRNHFSFPTPSPKAASSWSSVSINCACSGCLYQPQCVAFCIWFLSVGTALMKLFCIVEGISTSLVFRTEHIISHCYGSTCHRQMLKIGEAEGSWVQDQPEIYLNRTNA